MKVTFVPMKPTAIDGHLILIRGENLGTIRLVPGYPPQYQYQATINLPNGGNFSLIQGFGSTRENAILDAINSSRRDAARLLNAIETLERDLGDD